MLAWVAAYSLTVFAPAPVQTPTIMKDPPPTEAPAPEAPAPEPELEPLPEPEPEPEPAAPPTVPEPTLEAAAPEAEAPAAPLPGPDPTAAPPMATDAETAPVFDAVPGRYVRIDRPGFRGSGFFAAAVATLGAGITFQISERVWCGGCGPGFTERAFFAHTFVFAALAGHQRGKADAFDDAVTKRQRSVDGIRASGAALLGVGLLVGVINEGLWWSGMAGVGPFARNDFIKMQAVSRGLLDVSVIASSTGVGLLTWQRRYRRDRRAYRNARVVSAAPQLGQGYAGLSLQGAF